LHHVIVRAKSRGGADDGSGNGVMLCGWAPGLAIAKFADGTGKRVPAGAKIDLELHYTTTGSPQTDQTEVAFYLLPGKPQREMTTRAAVQFDLNIPPGTDESRDSAIYGFEHPVPIRKSACILASNHGTKCSSAPLMLPMTPEQPRPLL